MAVELMETLKEAITGVSPTTFFTVFATSVTVYYIVSVFFMRGSSDHRQQHSPMYSEEDRSTPSSPSSSHSNPASISQSWNYDLFLSFRGEDTRKGFVDHLYTALEQRGIQTYKDDETLPRGESIRPALLKAIQESRIAVIVLSKNYADSSWCLDELAHIMECMDTRGQIVEPIFYHVDPSDVRKQNGEYRKAFRKCKRENKHKVESWRKALKTAGNLSGWVIDENSHEAKCIRDIVGTVSSRLSSVITNDNKDLIGIGTRLQDLKSKLKIESGGVRIIGIWGVGGGGKTTLASAAYAEISHLFEACCLLKNIREESGKHGLKKLQEKILSVALKTTVVVHSEIVGRSMIKKRLCHKRVLVVLDDVDDLEQLEALAGSHDWFGEGSRIIITTRDKHLLSSRAHTNIYEVSLLSPYEAIKLFNIHAYHKDKPIEDYEKLSLRVVSYAGGLPLALKVLGSFLYDKDKDEWKSTLSKLKCIPEDKVMERLKISYDGLTPDEKVLFLDIACFFRGEGKDDAMMVFDACNFYPVIGIKVLEQKSLIKVVDGEFEIDDLIEEMAHYIVRGEHPNNPEKYSRIWNREDIEYLCDMGAAAPSMENEVLAKLPTHISHPGLFDVVANMKKLRWILWDYSPASSFPSNFQPTKLRCLMLRASKLKQLWEGCKHLPNLKILDLTYSENLIRTPDFDGLPRLERLILEGCYSLEEIHPSIGYHKRLVFVDMSYCSGLKSFPPIIQMQMLETLILGDCNQLQEFPVIQSNMSLPYLKILDLRRSFNLITTPDFEGLPCLERMILEGCYSLEEIHPSIGYHKRLVTVDMSYCSGLESFPPIIQMQMLETLNLHGCGLQEFPDIQSNMVSLSLPNLKILDLSWSQNLIRTPDFEGLPCLEELHLSRCKSLEEIHPSIGYHKRLVFVDMSYCSGLKSFPPIIQMQMLETLILSDCNQLQQFPDIQSNMVSLSLPNLKTLDLRRSISLIKTPDFEGLPCLERLILEGCWSLKEIHPSIGYHKRLVFVDMSYCWRLKRFPPIIHMKKLESLNLSHCKLKQFPDIESNMDSLVTLDLSWNGIEIVPPSVARFCTNLVSLGLGGCSMGLQSFHQVSLNLPQFPRSLRKLDLSDCNLGDGDIPSDICELLHVQILYLYKNQFSRLPSGISRLPCLKLLNLSHCWNLVELPDLPSSIAILKAHECRSLEIVRDLSDYKWLWKVSFPERTNKRVLLSMLEENAVKDRFMSVLTPNVQPSSIYTKLVTLQLPHNWYSDFSGFFLSSRTLYGMYRIVIKPEMSTDHPEEFGEDWEQCKFGDDHSEKFNNDLKPYDSESVGTDYSHESDDEREQCNYERVGYVPFSSLRHIPWFNPIHTKDISLQTLDNGGLNVELVRSKSKIGDLNEHPIDCSECWDGEFKDKKTFDIAYDSKSSEILISWEHW